MNITGGNQRKIQIKYELLKKYKLKGLVLNITRNANKV